MWYNAYKGSRLTKGIEYNVYYIGGFPYETVKVLWLQKKGLGGALLHVTIMDDSSI